jgi:prepilin-type N-terminal cleavage/methylation domain-containing protein
MNRPPRKYWKAYPHHGFTLVEVVASLMLLGTLLVGILAAHRRHAEQVHGAKARLAAVSAADKLLVRWREEGEWGARATTGRCEGQDAMSWRWSITVAPELRSIGAAVGRLEIFCTNYFDQRPLASVEILIADGAAIAKSEDSSER